MQVNPKESAGAKRWFFIAGGAAICLSIFIRQVDYRLSHSTKEKVLGETLHEMRTAQIALPARVTDLRLNASTHGFARPGLEDANNPLDAQAAPAHGGAKHGAHH